MEHIRKTYFAMYYPYKQHIYCLFDSYLIHIITLYEKNAKVATFMSKS